MIAWLKRQCTNLVQLEQNNDKLALGCSIAIYIAFCPFIGFHTIMTFLFSWLCGLNVALLLTVSMLINNPWSMIPIYSMGYWCGDQLCMLIGFNHHAYNPQWIIMANKWIHHYIAWEGFSFWTFMIGGNIVGLLLALISYPIIAWLTRTFNSSHREKVIQTVLNSKQAMHSLKAKAAPMIRRVTEKSRVQRTAYENSGSK